MDRQIEALARVCQHLADARKAYREFLNVRNTDDTDGVGRELQTVAAHAAAIRQRVEDERRRRNDAIYGAGVLRVAVRGNESEVNVTVMRPDNKSDLPYVSEAVYNAVRHRLGTAQLSISASFALNVVAASGRIVATIPPK